MMYRQWCVTRESPEHSWRDALVRPTNRDTVILYKKKIQLAMKQQSKKVLPRGISKATNYTRTMVEKSFWRSGVSAERRR